MTAAQPQTAPLDPTARLNLDFAEALRALRDAGQEELACRLAARAWSTLRHTHPAEARRLERLLHALARPPSVQKPSNQQEP